MQAINTVAGSLLPALPPQTGCQSGGAESWLCRRVATRQMRALGTPLNVCVTASSSESPRGLRELVIITPDNCHQMFDFTSAEARI